MAAAPADPVVIRLALHADLDAIVALWAVIFPEYLDPRAPQRDPRTNAKRKLDFGDDLFWVAEQGGEVVGSAMAGWDGHRGWLYAIGVHPSARRGGLGRRLTATAVEALRVRGCDKVNLQVMAENRTALAFWSAAGWAPDGVMSLGRRI